MNIITDSQWAEWRLSPVTQEFFKYLKMKKCAVGVLRQQMVRSNEDKISGFDLAKMNGIDDTLTGLLGLKLQAMTEEIKDGAEMIKNYKRMLKEDFGVENEHL